MKQHAHVPMLWFGDHINFNTAECGGAEHSSFLRSSLWVILTMHPKKGFIATCSPPHWVKVRCLNLYCLEKCMVVHLSNDLIWTSLPPSQVSAQLRWSQWAYVADAHSWCPIAHSRLISASSTHSEMGTHRILLSWSLLFLWVVLTQLTTTGTQARPAVTDQGTYLSTCLPRPCFSKESLLTRL